MKRAFILLLDSFGIGAALDAEKFGDKGANTLGHIAQRCAAEQANQEGIGMAITFAKSHTIGITISRYCK